MPTKISAVYSKMNSFHEEPDFLKNPFYCQESPFEVMKVFADKHFIWRFKNIESKVGSYKIVESDQKRNSQMLFFGGFNLEEYIPSSEGIEIIGKIKEYNPEFPESKIDDNMKNSIIKGLIKSYLISTIETDPGHQTIGPEGRIIGKPKDATQKVINYFKTRQKQKDPEKEKYLFEILEYAQALIREEFSLKN